MVILNWLRFAVSMLFLLLGVYLFAVQIFGVFKFNYVLNRMHAAAMGDTLGIMSCLIGLMILSGWNFTTLKFGLIILFLWCSSPVSSHLISRLQASSDESLEEHCKLDEKVKEELSKLTDREEM